MNKNFEEAYKAEVQQNIPDLWNRIESGLPEKKVIPEVPVAAVESKPVQEVKEVQTNLNHKSNKKKNPYAWMKWASLAAAAMLVIILIPTLLGIGALFLVSDKSSSTDMAMNEGAAEQMVTTDSVAEEEVKLESADMENTAETPAMNQNIAEDGYAEESIMGTEASSDVLSDVQSAETESEYPWELYADGLYVKVISAMATQDGYAVELELYKLHDNLAGPVLENSPYYDNGIIQATVYNGKGEVPVVGEKYTATLYGIPEQYSLILPFKAVLELKE